MIVCINVFKVWFHEYSFSPPSISLNFPLILSLIRFRITLSFYWQYQTIGVLCFEPCRVKVYHRMKWLMRNTSMWYILDQVYMYFFLSNCIKWVIGYTFVLQGSRLTHQVFLRLIYVIGLFMHTNKFLINLYYMILFWCIKNYFVRDSTT